MLQHDDFLAQDVYTAWLDHNMEQLTAADDAVEDDRESASQAGAAINRKDPLASLDFFREGAPTRMGETPLPVVGPPNTEAVPAPLQATVSEILVDEGDVGS